MAINETLIHAIEWRAAGRLGIAMDQRITKIMHLNSIELQAVHCVLGAQDPAGRFCFQPSQPIHQIAEERGILI
ncbi:MAG: hypothetical protein PHH58_09100 [Rhodoferax sp.]|nr:hypothetical protein [Rhodoferax sp.]